MAGASSGEDDSFWPGYVDALTAMVKVLTLIMMLLGIVVFSLSQNISRVILLKVAEAAGVKPEESVSVEELTNKIIEAIQKREERPAVVVGSDQSGRNLGGGGPRDEVSGSATYRGNAAQSAAAPESSSLSPAPVVNRIMALPPAPGTAAAPPPPQPNATEPSAAQVSQLPPPAETPPAVAAPQQIVAASPSSPASPSESTAPPPAGSAAASASSSASSAPDAPLVSATAPVAAATSAQRRQPAVRRPRRRQFRSVKHHRGREGRLPRHAGPGGRSSARAVRVGTRALARSARREAGRRDDHLRTPGRHDASHPGSGTRQGDRPHQHPVQDNATRLDDPANEKLRSTISETPSFSTARIVEVRGQAGISTGSVTDARRIAYQRVLVVRNELLAAGIKPETLRLKIEDTLSPTDGSVVRVVAGQ